jgi:hypothetical protein
MTTSLDFESPVHLKAVAADNQPPVTPEPEDLYRGFEQELLVPTLWAAIQYLLPTIRVEFHRLARGAENAR